MNRFSNKAFISIVTLLLLVFSVLSGCNNAESQKQAKAVSGERKGAEIKMGLPSSNASYLPLFVADKKGFFQDRHLTVTFTKVQGGVTALRGLQTNDFQVISSLPESVITGVAEGAGVKMIGTLDDKSMYSIYTTKDVKSPEDLKGAVVATNRTGNGTDIQLRWWLKKHGLEPEKDVRIIEAGENSTRLQSLISGQAKLTILSQPTDLKAEASGMKKLALMRDELKTYNHNMLMANGDFLKNQPEAAKAFVEAIGKATEYAKKPENRKEMVQVIMDELQMNRKDAEKSFDFVLPALADKAKINRDGVQWAIDTTKETGLLKENVTTDQLIYENASAK
ncbi:ABC transporter substrate-binding protein [Fictibacillus terranigra]|uniref:ABC transporter substrate-binding protein n=1 Tax=Fictibacillus terranigra TaxID=3058424 RepID=A0ABT8EBW6_9BACL|nr:ABC transporter substrate-binding protein [Fictibacillus sp. CENA-BCM004]MDN4075422.1 ABC transporter substrate-binding protein [Fictibacillus sp. CENA-BCM004]